MLAWAFAIVRAWTSLYTTGMPSALATARRAEIESDLWEFARALDAEKEIATASDHTAARRHDHLPPSVHVLVRLVLGVPDDLLWRAELMDLRNRRRTGVWIATATAIVVTGLWLRETRQPLNLPEIPRSPVTMQVWLTQPMPPPPPPPPPPPEYLRQNAQAKRPARAMPPPPAPKNPR